MNVFDRISVCVRQGRSQEFHLGGGYKFELVIPISKSKHVNVPHVNKTDSKNL